MTADADCIITSADIEKLLILMLNCYIMALKKTETGSKWGIETTQESNERFAKMTVKELLGSKPDPSFVPIEEVHSWLGKVPLVGQLFEDVLTACIMNPECVLEGAHHGISEGCEETVEHVEYNKWVSVLSTVGCRLRILAIATVGYMEMCRCYGWGKSPTES